MSDSDVLFGLISIYVMYFSRRREIYIDTVRRGERSVVRETEIESSGERRINIK